VQKGAKFEVKPAWRWAGIRNLAGLDETHRLKPVPRSLPEEVAQGRLGLQEAEAMARGKLLVARTRAEY